jgi:hypothetical protein
MSLHFIYFYNFVQIFIWTRQKLVPAPTAKAGSNAFMHVCNIEQNIEQIYTKQYIQSETNKYYKGKYKVEVWRN